MTSASHIRKKMMMIGVKRSALDEAHGRLVIVKIGFALAFILVAARLMDLSFIQGELQARLSGDGRQEAQVAARPQSSGRADIVDRNGVLLATSLETASLYADPLLITDAEKVAKGLADIIPDLAYGDVLQRLQRKGRFVWLKRNLTPDEQYKILLMGEPGLAFKSEMKRIYPQGRLTAHMVGYTDVDGQGLGGVERSFNTLLQEGASPLRLSLDVRLQHILRRELGREIKTFKARGGAGVVMDVKTGEVLAAISLPDFDPQNPGDSPPQNLFNNVTLGVYELGSTFKLFSTAALLELKKTPMGYKFDAREPLKVGRFTIRDYHPEKRLMTVPEVFMHSSNIGSALMGQMVGTEGLRNFYSDLGLLSKMTFEVEEIGAPIVPRPWREVNTLTASFGHGVAVTPLQMVSAAASIAGGGTLVRPTLIDRSDAPPQKNKTEVRVVSAETAHRVRQLLRLAVTAGTGGNAEVPGYVVGGKTGTAEKPGRSGYDRKRLLSSFLGFFPMEEPRYAVFVMVDEPQGTKETYGYATGGWVAAPAVGRVIASMAAVLNLKQQEQVAGKDISDELRRYVQDKRKGATAAATATPAAPAPAVVPHTVPPAQPSLPITPAALVPASPQETAEVINASH